MKRTRNPMSTGAKVALGIVGLAAGAGVLYAATREPTPAKTAAAPRRGLPPTPTPDQPGTTRETLFEEQHFIEGGGVLHATVVREQRGSDVRFIATVSVLELGAPVPKIYTEAFPTEVAANDYIAKAYTDWKVVLEPEPEVS